MDKIFIDLDNDNPGVILVEIFKFLFPSCKSKGKDIMMLYPVNKYFKKVLDYQHPKFMILRVCGFNICKKCTPDYKILKKLERALIGATQDRWKGWIHFDTKEQAYKYEHIVAKNFRIKGRCCFGKGLAIR